MTTSRFARAYLRENVLFSLDDHGRAGLKKFFDSAADLGIVQTSRTIRFYAPGTRANAP